MNQKSSNMEQITTMIIERFHKIDALYIFHMGNFRSQPLLDKSPVLGENKRLSFCANGMCGWRIGMEDAHVAQPNFTKDCSLFCVFDGHGGAEVAKFCETHFPEELGRNKNFDKKSYQLALSQTFLKMDEILMTEAGKKQIMAIKRKHQQTKSDMESYAGCTSNVILITDTHIYCANAGDSRSVLSSKGKAEALSVDHKPEDQIQYKRIQKAGGEVYQGRVDGNLNLSRAIGDLEYKSNKTLKPEEQKISAKPDILKHGIGGTDFIVMGCDGIWEVKTNQEMIDYVGSKLKEHSLQEITQKLLDELVAPNTSQEFGMDNMSVILIQFKK